MGSNGLIIVSALALAALLALQPTIAQAGEPHRLRVAVTAPVLAPLVESLGGGGVEVDSIIPPGADPHTYEPPARLAGALDGYDVIVMSGPHHLRVEEVILEWRRQGLLRHPIIVYYGNYTGCGLRPLEYGGSQNPHGYWWGPRSLAAVARCVGEALAEADPARAGYYTSRASLYAAMAESLAGRLEGVRVAAYSPVVQYLVEESGGRLVYTAALGPGAEPAADAAAAVERLYRNGTIDVFVVTWVDEAMSRAARGLAERLRGLGVPVAVLPLGEPGLDPLEAMALSQGAVLDAARRGPAAGGGGGGLPCGVASWWGVGVAGFMAGLVVAVAWVRASRG